MKFIFGVCFLLFSTAMSCEKKADEDILPEITQSGANTFGFLINNRVWIPKGYTSPHANYRLLVDPTYSDGHLDIRVYRIEHGIREDFSLASDSIRSTGIYKIADGGRSQNRFQKSTSDFSMQHCEIYYGGVFHRSGYIKVTRYDLVNRIVSGEFEITMINTSCGLGDTIRITKGRFDKKL